MLVAPTDIEVTNDRSFLKSMLSINDLVDRLAKLTAVQIVIVDTCRDDPFAATAR
jgi:DNA polymerase III alpha subunit